MSRIIPNYQICNSIPRLVAVSTAQGEGSLFFIGLNPVNLLLVSNNLCKFVGSYETAVFSHCTLCPDSGIKCNESQKLSHYRETDRA